MDPDRPIDATADANSPTGGTRRESSESSVRELDDGVVRTEAARRVRERWFAAARVILWTAMTIGLTLDHRDDLGSYIPGDPGDSYLVLALLQWGADRSTELFAGFWAGPIFAGGGNAMAYSETFLVLAVPFKVIEAVTGSAVIAFNVLYVTGWVLCGEATYALANRLLRSRSAALAVAAAFTFSTIRVNGSNHFQLTWAGLIPLSMLSLFRFWDRPSARRGAVLAAVVLAQVLSSAYYGVIVLVVVGAAMGLSFLNDVAQGRWAARVRGIATFFVLVAMPMLYVQRQYASVEDLVTSRPDYPAPFVSRLGDLRAPPPTTTFLDSVWLLDSVSSNRTPENHAYVGALVLVGIPALLAILLVRRRAALTRVAPSREWAVVVAAGVLGFGIALGRGNIAGVPVPIYAIARRLIPGVSDMVAIGRLVVFAQLAFVMLAGIALVHLLTHVRRALVRSAMCAAILVVVGVEAAMTHSMVGVIEPSSGSANAHLQDVGDGVVALLPMAPLSAGILQPFTEGPRMVLGADDQLRSVNGYSGYAPIGYERTVDALNRFPEADAIDQLRRLNVQFVVIYTAGLEIPGSTVDDTINGSGLAFWPRDEAERRIALAPSGLIRRRVDASDGIVLELAG